MSCLKNLSSRAVHRIYVEEDAFGYDITRKVLKKYSDCDIVKINNYKDVFNRTRQSFSLQKKFPQLILAVKKDTFIYEVLPCVRILVIKATIMQLIKLYF